MIRFYPENIDHCIHIINPLTNLQSSFYNPYRINASHLSIKYSSSIKYSHLASHPSFRSKPYSFILKKMQKDPQPHINLILHNLLWYDRFICILYIQKSNIYSLKYLMRITVEMLNSIIMKCTKRQTRIRINFWWILLLMS